MVNVDLLKQYEELRKLHSGLVRKAKVIYDYAAKLNLRDMDYIDNICIDPEYEKEYMDYETSRDKYIRESIEKQKLDAIKLSKLLTARKQILEHVSEDLCVDTLGTTFNILREFYHDVKSDFERNQLRTMEFDEEEVECMREMLSQLACGYEREEYTYHCCNLNEIVEKMDTFLSGLKEEN